MKSPVPKWLDCIRNGSWEIGSPTAGVDGEVCQQYGVTTRACDLIWHCPNLKNARRWPVWNLTDCAKLITWLLMVDVNYCQSRKASPSFFLLLFYAASIPALKLVSELNSYTGPSICNPLTPNPGRLGNTHSLSFFISLASQSPAWKEFQDCLLGTGQQRQD